MIEGQFRRILEKLLDKSRAKEVKWIACDSSVTDTGIGYRPEEALAVEFGVPEARIELRYKSPAASPDVAFADMFIEDRRAASLSGEDGAYESDFELIGELWKAAHESIYGWQAAVQKIEAALDSDRDIGIDF